MFDPAASLPPELQAEIHAAARRWAQMDAEGRRLVFRVTGAGVRVYECEESGRLIRRLSAAEALAVAAGSDA